MVEWQWKVFGELSKEELYQILRLREQVFIVEQNCVYEDIDNLDAAAWHLTGWVAGAPGVRSIGAYLRVLAPGVKFKEISLGRVITNPLYRKSGLGRELMAKAILMVDTTFDNKSIRISAQYHLNSFYSEFGFEQVSEPYDEDGIPHIEMLKV